MMKIDVYDSKGKKKSTKTLPKEVFGQEVNKDLIAQAVHVHLLNKRQGTRATKGRSDLSFSGRKIWRQKGTGRARHGDKTANLFRKGAKAHGPKPRKFSGKLPKKMRHNALRSVLSYCANNDQITMVEEINIKPPKLTSQAAELLDNLKFKKGLVVVGSKEDKNVKLGVRNLPGINLIKGQRLSVYDAANAGKIVFTKAGFKEVVDRLSGGKSK